MTSCLRADDFISSVLVKITGRGLTIPSVFAPMMQSSLTPTKTSSSAADDAVELFMQTSPLEPFARDAVQRQADDRAANVMDAASYLSSIHAFYYY